MDVAWKEGDIPLFFLPRVSLYRSTIARAFSEARISVERGSERIKDRNTKESRFPRKPSFPRVSAHCLNAKWTTYVTAVCAVDRSPQGLFSLPLSLSLYLEERK